eukprot:scaffold289269_cov41-Prasinocladus_malaysianus.AAC.1
MPASLFASIRSHMQLCSENSARLQVGFPRRSPQRLSLALQHTHRVLWVRCIRTSHHGRVGKLVGFARATSDGSLAATIWDVAVGALVVCDQKPDWLSTA